MAEIEQRQYAFDLTLKVAIRVSGTSFAQAVERLREAFDCADANFGSWPGGDPILGEASLAGDVSKDNLFEIDGDPPEVCPGCGAIEGEPEWGTVGDGFDGYCGACADKREQDGSGEIG